MIEHICDWCGESMDDHVEVFNKETKDFEIICHKCFHESTIKSDKKRITE